MKSAIQDITLASASERIRGMEGQLGCTMLQRKAQGAWRVTVLLSDGWAQRQLLLCTSNSREISLQTKQLLAHLMKPALA